jgi:putative inorganic carbon (hco3(-)) transporter
MTAVAGGRSPARSRPGAPRTIGPFAAAVLVCLGAAVLGLTAGEIGPMVLAGILLLVAAAGVVLRPDLATPMFLAILYSNAAALAVARYDVPFFAGAMFPLLLVVPFAYHVILRRQPIIVTSGLPFLLVYCVIVIVGVVLGMSADPDRALDMLTTLTLEGVAIYFLLTNVVRSLDDLRVATWVLLAVGGVLGMLAAHQQLTSNFGSDYYGFSQVSGAEIGADPITDQGQPRLAGPIGEKNRYAQILTVLVPLGLFRMWGERRRILQVAALVATGFIGVGIVLSFSRGAALGLAALVGLMIILRYIRPVQVVALALAGLALLATQPTYFERLTTIQAVAGATGTRGEAAVEDGSIRKRANEMIAAALVFADHPVIGVGRGLFPVYYGVYGDEVGLIQDAEARQAHNLFLGILAETGILGFTAFMAIFSATLFDLARVRRRWLARAPAVADMATAYGLAIVAYLTTGMFLHLAYERYLWVLLALAGVAAVIGLQHRQPDASPVEDGDEGTAAHTPRMRALERRGPLDAGPVRG